MEIHKEIKDVCADFKYNSDTKEIHMLGDRDFAEPGGFGHILFHRMKLHIQDGLVAQIDVRNGKKETFKELFTRSVKLALYLKDSGIQAGDVILMCTFNNIYNTLFFLGCQLIGAISAVIPPIFSQDDTNYLIELVEPKHIFIADIGAEKIRIAVDTIGKQIKITSFCGHGFLETFEQLIAKYTNEDVQSFIPIYIDKLDTIACIVFSSGTTDNPKAACLSHNYISSGFSEGIVHEPGQICFGYTSLYWCSAIYFTITSVYYGMIKLSAETFEPTSIWQIIEEHKINICYITYAHAIDALPYLKQCPTHLQYFVILGGSIPDHVYTMYTQKISHCRIVLTYGMTESGMVTLSMSNAKMGSIGKLIKNGQIIKVVDPNTEKTLNLNEIGEIRIKAKHQMSKYYNSEEHPWDMDGFLKTGDLGYIDEESYLFIVDRVKTVYKYQAYQISPAKIEKVLFRHPEVLHAVVIPVKHSDCQNYSTAIVVLKSNATATSEDLVEYVNRHVDVLHKLYGGVRIISSSNMPYTATGKINRRLLCKIYNSI